MRNAVEKESSAQALQFEVQQFLFREAKYLDRREWANWEALFTEDGMYWVPLTYDQQDPLNHSSLFYEDATMREVRWRRLEHANAWSQQPLTRAVRLVGNVMIDAGSRDEGWLTVSSSLQVTEWRLAREQRQIVGHVTHSLELVEDSWRIKQKRVALISCNGLHSAFEHFI
jgi:benzoate/toluate 1,2-dioxygenase beta subunit